MEHRIEMTDRTRQRTHAELSAKTTAQLRELQDNLELSEPVEVEVWEMAEKIIQSRSK